MSSHDGATIKPKRGRRTKKEIEAAKALAEAETQTKVIIEQPKVIIDQPKVIIDQPKVETTAEIQNAENIELSILGDDTNDANAENIIMDDIANENVIVKPGVKKRGRKPKGGKIIQQTLPITIQKESKPNIILHLKCSLKDLASDGEHNSNFTSANIDPYNFVSNNSDLTYEILASNLLNNPINYTNNDESYTNINKLYAIKETNRVNDDNEDLTTTNETREIWRKLKVLEQDLHINNISDKKSACFWCSCDFDNPPIYIPKHFIKDSYHVYGCFCTPECAVAHLMEENIDSSTKFERYHLINHIYSKIYEYKKNIKPAPNPHYMLDKYYGNLTIQEYRSLLRSERLFLIVDKPLTRILPEFHEDNDDFIINNKIIPSSNYQVKKRVQKKTPQTKTNILNEKFGIQNVVAPAQ